MKLSILILTTPERKHFLDRLETELLRQIMNSGEHENIEILVNDSPGNIGGKRNWLLNEAKGKYLNFFDDDDMPGNYYIDTLLKGINSGVDCISLAGIYYIDGVMDGRFEHSIVYDKWQTNMHNPVKYERMPNHLNCIKSSIAKQIKFPQKNFGEDHQWSIDLQKSGLIKSEYRTQEVLYHYYYRTKK